MIEGMTLVGRRKQFNKAWLVGHSSRTGWTSSVCDTLLCRRWWGKVVQIFVSEDDSCRSSTQKYNITILSHQPYCTNIYRHEPVWHVDMATAKQEMNVCRIPHQLEPLLHRSTSDSGSIVLMTCGIAGKVVPLLHGLLFPHSWSGDYTQIFGI